jgi:hypothetical protein
MLRFINTNSAWNKGRDRPGRWITIQNATHVARNPYLEIRVEFARRWIASWGLVNNEGSLEVRKGGTGNWSRQALPAPQPGPQFPTSTKFVLKSPAAIDRDFFSSTMTFFSRALRRPPQLTAIKPRLTRCFSHQIDNITESLLTDTQRSVRQEIQKLCSQFPDTYWAEADRNHKYPIEFRKAITAGGWLGITLPAEYGGSELGVSEATVMMQTIAESGAGVAGAQSIHANIYPLVPVAKFGSKEQKERWLSALIEGKNTACFGVTEPDVGSETYKLKARAVKQGDKYIVNGQKMYYQHSQRT